MFFIKIILFFKYLATFDFLLFVSYPFREKTINFSIETKKLDKKPTQSFFKSYLKLAAQAGNTRQKFGMRINNVAFLDNYLNYTGKNFKITNISFISIKEY